MGLISKDTPFNEATLETVVREIRKLSTEIKNKCNSIVAVTAVRNRTLLKLLEDVQQINENAARIDALSSRTGLVQYIRDQVGDQTRDVRAEYLAMRAAADDLETWVTSALVGRTIVGWPNPSIPEFDGLEFTEITPAQSSGLRTRCQTLANTID